MLVCLVVVLQLLSVSSDGLMKLWTIKTQECDATFDEHSDRVWALAISPDGQEVRQDGGIDVQASQCSLAQAQDR